MLHVTSPYNKEPQRWFSFGCMVDAWLRFFLFKIEQCSPYVIYVFLTFYVECKEGYDDPDLSGTCDACKFGQYKVGSNCVFCVFWTFLNASRIYNINKWYHLMQQTALKICIHWSIRWVQTVCFVFFGLF